MTMRRQLTGVSVGKLGYNNSSISHVSEDLAGGLQAKPLGNIISKTIFSESLTKLNASNMSQLDLPAEFDTKLKKPRTSRPKVRSGCFTCK